MIRDFDFLELIQKSNALKVLRDFLVNFFVLLGNICCSIFTACYSNFMLFLVGVCQGVQLVLHNIICLDCHKSSSLSNNDESKGNRRYLCFVYRAVT